MASNPYEFNLDSILFKLENVGMDVADEFVKSFRGSSNDSGLCTLTVSVYADCVMAMV